MRPSVPPVVAPEYRTILMPAKQQDLEPESKRHRPGCLVGHESHYIEGNSCSYRWHAAKRARADTRIQYVNPNAVADQRWYESELKRETVQRWVRHGKAKDFAAKGGRLEFTHDSFTTGWWPWKNEEHHIIPCGSLNAMLEDLIITAMGAVTSVGLDAVTTCASIRAGISRPETLVEHAVLDREEYEGVGVTGHPIPLVTRGFTGGGRWIQMAALALEDLCRSAQLPPAGDTPFWSSTLSIVVTPVIDVRRFIREEAWATEEMVRSRLLSALDRRVGSFFSLTRASVWCRGRIGVLEAIQAAAEHVRHQRCERVVVLAVDWLTDGAGLAWLSEQGRLKHDENPAALAPGEGAVPLMADDDEVTSRAAVFWDAIACGHWDAAAEIARHSRSTVNPAWEHEDDFLYVWFLMTRYFLDDGSLEAEERQRALLARWSVVLEGRPDPRRDLCEALLHRDTRAFQAAFDATGDAREAELRRRLDDHTLPADDAAWSMPVWLEGLALLRLAERDGLQPDACSLGIPWACRPPAWPPAVAGP